MIQVLSVPKQTLFILIFVAALLYSNQAQAMAGIGSAGYIWLLIPVIMFVIFLLFMIFKFLRNIKRDCADHDNTTKGAAED